MSDFKRYDVEMSGHFQELVERDNGDLMNFDDHDSIAISLHGQIAQLKADNKLLREYMLLIAKETDNETLSLAGVNQAANHALALTEDAQCHTQK
jgi:hypothetical protein